MSFSDRLIHSRKKLGYTQQDVADLISVSRPAVNLWEKSQDDEVFPRAKTLDKLAKALKVDVVWLRFGYVYNNKPQDDILTKEIKLLVSTSPTLLLHEVRPWLEKHKNILKKGALMTDSEIKETEFCVTVENDAMMNASDIENSLAMGEILKIDPTFQGGLKSGDLVLAQFGMTDNFKPRLYFKDGSEEVLVALNKKFPNIPVDENIRIIGKVTHSIRKKS